MKKISILLILCLVLSLFLTYTASADAFKQIKVGMLRDKIVDSINQGESHKSGQSAYMYYYYDLFRRSDNQQSATYLFCTDWKNAAGETLAIKQTGVGGGHVDENTVTMPIVAEDGLTIHAYYRNAPPSVVVDGVILNAVFPYEGDVLDPAHINGTADVMVESIVNTDMGVTIHQKVYGWDERNHDDYHIYDWTFTNTGNIDKDADIELPGQKINGFYVWRANRLGPAQTGSGAKNWYSRVGEFPSDSLRMRYAYSAKKSTTTYDNVGEPSTSTGWLQHPEMVGEATLYVQKAPNDLSDWPSEPSVSGNGNCDVVIANWLNYELSSDDIVTQYSIFTQGFNTVAGKWDNVFYTEADGVWPGSVHAVRMDEQAGVKYVQNNHFYTWHPWGGSSVGPWDLNFGESVRLVYAKVAGSISPRMGWDIGRAWKAGTAADTWEGEYKLSPKNADFPDLAPTDNDKAKDSWVYSSRDTLFMNANAAQFNADNDYEIPTAPPPPSIEVKSLPDKIRVEWGTESESAADFAGYRVYRAIPAGWDSCFWYPVFECGEGTANVLTHRYEDETAQRGVGYAYYVTAFDDGVSNIPDVDGQKVSLESGRNRNETSLLAAHLTRPAGEKLSDIRVVPNPFNLNATDLQYPGEQDKIMFLNVPAFCFIKIYNEGGDLIRTLIHDSGSGDQSWGKLSQEWSASEDGQIIVSGIYIAAFEVTGEDMNPTGEKAFVKFLIVR
ncbi:hypothetical protein MUP95_03565 [bacterium]|nr:hypothetical protein [bacterium]